VFGGPFADAAYEVKESSDGSFIVAGSSVTSVPTTQRNGFIVKLDSNGNFAWSLTYGGTADDEFSSLVTSVEGGIEYIIVAGYTKSFSALGGEDAWVLKVKSLDGSIEWQKRYGASSASGTTDRFQRVITSSYNGSIRYVFAGRTGTSTNNDFWIMITDKYGNVQMSRTYYYSTYHEGIWDIKETDGAFLLVGSAQRYFGATGSDIWVLKISKDNGEILWQKAFGSLDDDEPRTAIVTEDGGIIIAGTTRSIPTGTDSYDIWVLRLDKDGNLKWEKLYGVIGLSDRDQASSICLSDDGNFVVAGYTTTSSNNRDIFVMKIVPEGYIKFRSTSPMTSQDTAGFVTRTDAITQYPSISTSDTVATQQDARFMSQDRSFQIINHAP
jgi:hypothetical protein